MMINGCHLFVVVLWSSVGKKLTGAEGGWAGEDVVSNIKVELNKNCYLITQSKSKTTITRSVPGKFNCITVKYNGTI